MTHTTLFSNLPSAVYIRSDSAQKVAEQREASWGPEPQEDGGLGQAQTFVV